MWLIAEILISQSSLVKGRLQLNSTRSFFIMFSILCSDTRILNVPTTLAPLYCQLPICHLLLCWTCFLLKKKKKLQIVSVGCKVPESAPAPTVLLFIKNCITWSMDFQEQPCLQAIRFQIEKKECYKQPISSSPSFCRSKEYNFNNNV